MILVDTAIWVDHIARPVPALAELLVRGEVSMHPFVLGELALGNLRDRRVLNDLADLPRVELAFPDEVLSFVERHGLPGSGIGYVDAHLLVAARLTAVTALWTRDRRLYTVAQRLGVAFENPG